MKKLLAGLVATAAVAGSVNAVELATVNYELLYVNSKEGKALEREKERQVTAFRKTAMEEQQKLALKEQQLAQKLYGTQDADSRGDDTTKEVVSFEQAKLQAQSKVKNLELELKMFESKERTLRAKIDSAVEEFRSENSLPLIIASNYPGVKADKSLDKTDLVLKNIDKKYDAEVAKSAISAPKKEIKQV